MKKAKILFIVFTCGLLAACGKNNNTDMKPTELDIPGVEVMQERDDLEYTYKEQEDGSLNFTVKGKWEKNQKWNVISAEDAVATVKEVSQTNKKAEYHFTAKKELNGYSEYTISLSDTETNKTVYRIMFSVIADADAKLSVLNVYGYMPSEEKIESEEAESEAGTEEVSEENVEENLTTEDFTEDELTYIQDKENEYNELVGDVFIPEELTITGKDADTFEGKEIARTSLQYKENIFNCMIAPSVSVAEIKEGMESSKAVWNTKKIGETEVEYSEIEGDTIVVWMNKEGISFALSGRNVKDDITFEVVKLMIGNE